MQKKVIYHPVDLDREKCKGCINCMKRCPTEAIRVRDGKAQVLYEKCIGCGECVRICTHRAKRAVYDSMDDMGKFKYKIALAPPSLYGQFNNLDEIDYVLNGLKAIGFDDVFEVAKAAEICSLVTRKVLSSGNLGQVISSACPAIMEVIYLRFRSLRNNILQVLSPVEIAAKLARKRAERETGYAPEEIGVFFISPCAAKVYALKQHITTNKQYVDGCLAVKEVYFKLISAMKNLPNLQPITGSGIIGIGWAVSGGEAAGALKEKNIAADGIDNCMSVLKELENSELKEIDFVELNACPSGCVGGVLNIENAFVAKTRIQSLRRYLQVMPTKLEDYGEDIQYYLWERVPEAENLLKLGNSIDESFEIMLRIEEIEKTLPLLDCGACGAPSCRAFAEDVAIHNELREGCIRR